MAEDDIYGNKARYEAFKQHLDDFFKKPEQNRKRKYWGKNKTNKRYFFRLFERFEADDISFIRRNRILNTLKMLCHFTEKDLKDLTKDDLRRFKIEVNKTQGYESRKDIAKHIRHVIWPELFPDKKSLVEDFKFNHDPSTFRRRKDRLTWEEYERIISYFDSEPVMQAYISLGLESLGRPAEILSTLIEGVKLYDNYAKIYFERGKEGFGFLQCIDSFPYVVKWFKMHPRKHDPQCPFFLNQHGKLLTPYAINKRLKKAAKELGINKPITCYSLKRNGVTFRRLRGDSDVEIQHAARWTSTKQLKTYDLSTQEDAFKRELVKRGLIEDEGLAYLRPATKPCPYCGYRNGFSAKVCDNPACSRPLDRRRIEIRAKADEILTQILKDRPDILEQIAQTIIENYLRKKPS